MKRLSIYFILIASSVFNSGCQKYLDQLPDQRTQLNTPSKVSELLVTAYPRGSYFTFAESMSDNPIDNQSAVLIEDNRNVNPYRWENVEEVNQDSPTYYWNSCYTAIAAANQALEACNNAPNPQDYRAQKGEALVARAYAHFMLVTFFSKVYDPATANTDPGIPYVTEPETVVLKKYERQTVEYVYAQIERDLEEGISLINDNYAVPAYHFTSKAAHAFASRFYLFKRDAAKVIEHTNQAFPANNFAANMRPWFTYRTLTADGMRNTITRASESANLLLAETVSLWSRNYRNYRYSLSQAQLGRILAPVGTSLTAIPTYSVSSTSYYVIKFYEHFVRVNVNATTGTAYNMVPLFITEEVLFNRAEAYIMQGKYQEALADMNTYLSTRVVNYNPNTNSLTELKIKTYYQTQTEDIQKAFTLALLDLKRAEFIHEGMRWFDILRHKIPVVRRNTSGVQIDELGPEDPRRLVQIPESAIQAGIELNPR